MLFICFFGGRGGRRAKICFCFGWFLLFLKIWDILCFFVFFCGDVNELSVADKRSAWRPVEMRLIPRTVSFLSLTSLHLKKPRKKHP